MLTQEIFRTDATTALQIHGLTGGPAAQALFEDIDLQLPAGVSAVTADEGLGKTSLMRLLAGELAAKAGQMHLKDLHWPEQADLWRQEVFWADLRLPEHDDDTPEAYWGSLSARWPRFDPALLQALAERLKLDEHRYKNLFMLSAGSRRKVGLAGALACGASVTLLDQPFAALDLASIREVLGFLQDMSDHPTRAWVVADYEAPAGVTLASHIRL